MSREPGRPAPPDPAAPPAPTPAPTPAQAQSPAQAQPHTPAEVEPGARAARPRFLRRRRAEALAAIVPIAAFLALMPPFVRIFAHDGRVFGAPAALVFLMLLWSGLVIVTRLLARRLVRSDPEP